ncbi:MAG: N-6 DNA methylase, partial [Candidatus Cloacimonetes bacterium]|nr:N-6 DNA methylase [Candidatus Cloacimonadota bacterium]
DVNILGHIFEHSLTDIEKLNAEISGENLEKKQTRRKKEGVFYTPNYITKYIVENTIGTLCTEKRNDLQLNNLEIDQTYFKKAKKGIVTHSKKGERLSNKLEKYKNWLLSLKIIDPACGSGAFLNQSLNFLIDEHNFIINLETDLRKGQLSLFDIDIAVLENNLYGVDINEESIEIAKLSLWLKTAKKGRKLTDLSKHIKCGNSLIDDPEIAGEKAFNWNNEFPKIMKNGGFDVVIGNPPYVRSRDFEKSVSKFIQKKYNLTVSGYDLSTLFIEKLLSITKKSAISGIITTNKFFSARYGHKIREFLIQNKVLSKVINLRSGVFKDTPVETSILIFNYNSKEYVKYINVKKDDSNINFVDKTFKKIQNSYLLNSPQKIFFFPNSISEIIILEILQRNKFRIKDFFQFNAGLGITGISESLKIFKAKDDIPVYSGKSIWKYNCLEPEYWIEKNIIKSYISSETILVRELSTTNRALILEDEMIFSALNSITLVSSENKQYLKSFLILFNSTFFGRIFNLFFESTRNVSSNLGHILSLI